MGARARLERNHTGGLRSNALKTEIVGKDGRGALDCSGLPVSLRRTSGAERPAQATGLPHKTGNCGQLKPALDGLAAAGELGGEEPL